MRMSFVIIMFFICPLYSVAGSSNGIPGPPLLANNGNVFFNTSNHFSTPGCAGSNIDWVINTNTASGKSMFAYLLYLSATNKSVVVIGKGVCDIWGDRESVDYMFGN